MLNDDTQCHHSCMSGQRQCVSVESAGEAQRQVEMRRLMFPALDRSTAARASRTSVQLSKVLRDIALHCRSPYRTKLLLVQLQSCTFSSLSSNELRRLRRLKADAAALALVSVSNIMKPMDRRLALSIPYYRLTIVAESLAR